MAFDPSAPFTASAARAAGVSRRRLAGSGFQQLHRGVHVEAARRELDLVAECAAALLVLPPEAVFGRFTAARLWGVVVPRRSRLTVTVPHGRSGRLSTVEVTRARTMPERRTVRGLPVTSPEQTFLDLADRLDLVDLVVVGDGLVRRGLTTPAGLVAAARDFRGPRTAVARRAAGFVRSAVDSPMETRVRMLLVLAGLPEPVVNLVVRDEHGAWVHRFDLSYPHLRLAIEYDGRQHAQDPTQWRRDLARREDLDAHGWRVVVAVAEDVFGQPERLLERVCAAMSSRGQRVRVTDQQWRRHFPGRGA